MKTVRDICQYIGSVIDGSPICVETGCTYTGRGDDLVHTTTNNLYKYIVRKNGGWLYSLDIDPIHIEYARMLSELVSCSTDAYTFMPGDSVISMTKLAIKFKKDSSVVSVLCLDSKEFDEWHMVAEFDAIKQRLAEKHFVLVDDIHNVNSVKYKQLVPILKELDYSYVEVPTPTGMFVAARGYSLSQVG